MNEQQTGTVNRIFELVNEINEIHDNMFSEPGKFSSLMDRMKLQDAKLQEIRELGKTLPEGLFAGKIVRWQVADGYAVYVVTKTNSRTAYLHPVCIGDAWQFQGVGKNGATPLAVVEAAIKREEGLSRLFGASA